MFTFYCMKFYQRHYFLSELFSPAQRCHGVCVTISIYIRSFYLFMCSFYVILHVLYDSWVSYDLFCVNKMTTTIWLLFIQENSTDITMQQLPWRHMDAITSQITMNRLIVQQLVRANNTENNSSASPTLCCVFPHRGPVRWNVFPYHIDGLVQETRNSIANALE